MNQSGAIGVRIEQCLQHDALPDRRLADAGFEDRLFVRRVDVGIGQGNRQRTDILQRRFDAFALRRVESDGKFDPSH